METKTLKAERRTRMGTRTARQVRKNGGIPAVIYGHGQEPEGISLDHHDAVVELKHGARTLSVDLEGEAKQFLIKNVQYDHFGSTPIHLDLMRVDLHERVKVRVGIELKGTPKGISEGGVLDQTMPAIEVECVVTEIPGTLHPTVTHLGVGDSICVRDLVLPPGVVALANPDDRVATVRMLAVEAPVAPTAAVEGEEAVAEPERIGRVRKDEEEEAS